MYVQPLTYPYLLLFVPPAQVDVNLVIGEGSSLQAPVLRNVGARGLSSISQEVSPCVLHYTRPASRRFCSYH
jgi:hypothetical protein